MSKKGTIINEWEKLTAPSNRRLSVDDKVHPPKNSVVNRSNFMQKWVFEFWGLKREKRGRFRPLFLMFLLILIHRVTIFGRKSGPMYVFFP